MLLALAAAAVLLFATPRLDLLAERPFYRPNGLDHWPLAREPVVAALYGAAPWVTASLVLAGLGALAFALARGRDLLRRQAVFLLLAVVLGPGLVVNVVFKDHWHRPRPRDVVELGGELPYQPPLVPRRGSGGSFPCGHCSVGFLYGAGWWIWKRRRPAWARASLAAGLVAGFALGAGRMAAGGHFLSDVVWSGLLALGIAHALYCHVLRVPAHERALAAGAAAPSRWPRLRHAAAALAALGGLAVLAALFATPHGTPISARLPLAGLAPAPRVFELDARRSEVELVIEAMATPVVSVRGELHGFGLPTSRLEERTELDPGPPATLRYRVVQRGWFTDLDGLVRVELPAESFRRVTVRLGHGDIRVSDPTGAVAAGRLTLDLATADGRVRAPRPPIER